MNVQKMIIRTMIKLAKLEINEINDFIKEFKKFYKDPKKISLMLQKFNDTHDMDQKDKLKLLYEIKNNKLIDVTIPNVERTWRMILKNWGLAHYNLTNL